MNNLKRKFTQNDLRLLMNEKKRKLLETKKKVDSPLAKYLSDGTLMCIICNSLVKNEAQWTIHINAKQHKDNITRKKVQREVLSVPASTAVTKTKKESPISTTSQAKIKGILKNKTENPNTHPFQNESASRSFQNEPVRVSKDVSCQMEVDMETDTINSNELPEGFFDDPVQDAKARNADYKDPIEEEWERFKKEIQEENAVSDQIVEEDEDQSAVDREIEIIDENMHNWSRVRELEVQFEKVQKEKSARKNMGSLAMNEGSDQDSSYGSEEEFEEYIDWRSKRSFK